MMTITFFTIISSEIIFSMITFYPVFFISHIFIKIQFSKNELLLCAPICLFKSLVSVIDYLKSVGLVRSIKGTLEDIKNINTIVIINIVDISNFIRLKLVGF